MEKKSGQEKQKSPALEKENQILSTKICKLIRRGRTFRKVVQSRHRCKQILKKRDNKKRSKRKGLFVTSGMY